MAEKTKEKKRSKLIIAWVIAALVVVAGIVVAVLLLTRSKEINDDFFKDDGTKYVLTQDSGINGAIKTHTVLYYNSNDEITKWEVYGEYADADTAKAALEYIKSEDPENNEYELNDKYLIHRISEEHYGHGETASSYKEWFDTLRASEAENNSEEEPAAE